MYLLKNLSSSSKATKVRNNNRIAQNIREATYIDNILQKMPKDEDCNFLVMFFFYSEMQRDDLLLLATIRDDTWNVLKMQQIILLFKNSLVVSLKPTKGPAHMVEKREWMDEFNGLSWTADIKEVAVIHKCCVTINQNHD